MLTLRLSSVHIHHTFEVWTTEERRAAPLTSRSVHEFRANAPGLICVSVREKGSAVVLGMGTLEFSAALSGEHTMNVHGVRLRLETSVKGFLPETNFNLEVLRDQCATLSVREQRYADPVEGYEPTFTDDFGLHLPKYFVTMLVRDPTETERMVQSQLRDLSLMRRGSRRAAFSAAEAVSTLVHFCAARVTTGCWGSSARTGGRLRGDSSQLTHEMFFVASQMRGTGYTPSIVVVVDANDVEHCVLSLDDGGPPVVVDPTVTLVEADCPPDVKRLTSPTYTRVLAQYSATGHRIVNTDYETWCASACEHIPWRSMGSLDEMVMLKAARLQKEVPELDAEFLTMDAAGESGRHIVGRYMAMGTTPPLSGCRSIAIKARLWNKKHSWSEYLTF